MSAHRGGRLLPQVSVIIPAYNPGKRLRVALRTVIDQTMDDFEVIVVDDGSVEDLSWVASFDDRIRLIRQENQGVGMARNVGTASAHAPWVAFLDRRSRELFAEQAWDGLRAAFAERRLLRAATHLGSSVRLDPGVAVRNGWAWGCSVMQRVGSTPSTAR